MIPQKALLLHDIRSVHNVGSIFRTADAFGVQTIYISGHTPAPIDRFGRKRTDMAKVALGAEDAVGWEVVPGDSGLESALDFLKKQKKLGVRILVLEQDERSVNLNTVQPEDGRPTLLVVGNEAGGVPREIIELADVIAETPMLGKKESLNVSVSAGVAMYQVFGESHKSDHSGQQ